MGAGRSVPVCAYCVSTESTPALGARLQVHARLSTGLLLVVAAGMLQDVLACSGLIDAYFACAQQTAAS